MFQMERSGVQLLVESCHRLSLPVWTLVFKV